MLGRDWGGQTIICYKWLLFLTNVDVLCSIPKLVLSILLHFVELSPDLFEMLLPIKFLIKISNLQHANHLWVIQRYRSLVLYGAILLKFWQLIRHLILNRHKFRLQLLLLIVTRSSAIPWRNRNSIGQYGIFRTLIDIWDVIKFLIDDSLLFLLLLLKLLLLLD